MSKNIKNDDGDEWDNCPVCDRSVKTKNLERHLKKMHSDLSKSEFNEIAKSPGKGNKSTRSKRADLRKELESEQKRRNMVLGVAAVFIFIIVIAGAFYISNNPDVFKNDGASDLGPEPVQDSPEPTQKNEIKIPLSEVNDGIAHFYDYNSNGVKIRYFVLKSSDGVMRAAFDTCDVCYDAKRGYHQEGDEMVCNNCGQRFASVRINEEKGGCNPAPLDRTIDGNDLVIKIDDIENGRWYFD